VRKKRHHVGQHSFLASNAKVQEHASKREPPVWGRTVGTGKQAREEGKHERKKAGKKASSE
jgi:hypothetical protein